MNNYNTTIDYSHGSISVEGTVIFNLAVINNLENTMGKAERVEHGTSMREALAEAARKRGARGNHSEISEIEIGDVVAEMHGHETNFGTLKGWKVSGMFETSNEMATAIVGTFPAFEGMNKIPQGMSNKFARVVGITEDFDGNPMSVHVIYLYDSTYWQATLVRPE